MILVLGGTSDSLILANELIKLHKHSILSVATEYGNETASKSFSGNIICGRMGYEELKAFMIEERIGCIVDATHPYAYLVSQNAIAAANDLGINYIRYERPGIKIETNGVLCCDSFEEAGKIADVMEGNILITTGSKEIERLVCNIKDKNRIKARILSTSESIIKLENIGLNAENIIAMKGPFSQEMNGVMFADYKIKILICKDSGKQGGTEEKLVAAQKSNINVIVIGRPKIVYPKMFNSIDAVIDYLKEII